MQPLGRFAGADVDAHRTAELVVPEHPIEHAEEERVGGQLVEAAHLGEEGVDPLGVEPLEVVAAERGLLAVGRELVVEGSDLVRIEEPLDDDAPLGVEGVGHARDARLLG